MLSPGLAFYLSLLSRALPACLLSSQHTLRGPSCLALEDLQYWKSLGKKPVDLLPAVILCAVVLSS